MLRSIDAGVPTWKACRPHPKPSGISRSSTASTIAGPGLSTTTDTSPTMVILRTRGGRSQGSVRLLRAAAIFSSRSPIPFRSLAVGGSCGAIVLGFVLPSQASPDVILDSYIIDQKFPAHFGITLRAGSRVIVHEQYDLFRCIHVATTSGAGCSSMGSCSSTRQGRACWPSPDSARAEMIEDAFGGRDPRVAQRSMEVEDYAALLGEAEAGVHSSPGVQASPSKIFGRARVGPLNSTLTCRRCAVRPVVRLLMCMGTA